MKHIYLNDLTKCIFNLNLRDNEKNIPSSNSKSENHGFWNSIQKLPQIFEKTLIF